jgi:sialic acid synthase SpsE
MTKIIAELCQNHNGDKVVLSEMVHAAAEAGAHFAKIQSMRIENLTYRKRFELGLIEGGVTKVIKRPYRSEYSRLKNLMLSEKDHQYFIEICKKYKITPLTTIFTQDRIKFLESLKLSHIKISSFDCPSIGLLEKLSKSSFRNIILSTGASFNHEIILAKKILKKKKLSLLHCISIYPTPIELANINRIHYLKSINEDVGLSDHSNPDHFGHMVAACALEIGINYIERHFTILDKKKTKDGIVSVNPKQLKELVKISKYSKPKVKEYLISNVGSKNKKLILGNKYRELSNLELLNRDYYQGRFAAKRKKKYYFNWEK